MKTRLLIIVGIILYVSVFVQYSEGVPKLDREHAYEKVDFVLYGEILSVDVLSESIQTQDKNSYRETPGKVVYSIKIHNFIKNSIDDDVISAYGDYLEKPHGMSFTPSLYKIGDEIEFYIHIFNETESSYDYLIDSGASRYIPSECKYDLPPDDTGWIYDTHDCSWKKITSEKNDYSICGPGTEYVEGTCQVVKTEKIKTVGDDAPFFGIFVYLDNLLSWIFGK